MIKKLLLILTLTFTTTYAEKMTLQETLNALDYIRTENQEIAAKVIDLVNQTEGAIDNVDFFKMIDILIQTLINTIERIKYFDENFYDHVRVAHIIDTLSKQEDEEIKTELI